VNLRWEDHPGYSVLIEDKPSGFLDRNSTWTSVARVSQRTRKRAGIEPGMRDWEGTIVDPGSWRFVAFAPPTVLPCRTRAAAKELTEKAYRAWQATLALEAMP
jgi:hypothetical protein